MPKQINSFSGKNDKGFTLVEILVSLVILLILVVAFVPMFTFVAQAISNNQAKDTATALANKAIEDIRSLPFIVLDKETGLVVTDPNVPQLGIKNDAECPGSIPAQQILLIKDKTYTVDTQIVWVDNMYKKVSVSVEYLSAFNNKEVVSNFYTIASEEGELKTSLTGNILVKILNKDGNHFDGASIDVKVFDAEGLEISSGTTVDGEKLFEELEIGSYVVSVRVGSLAHSPDQTIVDGWLVLNKQVTSDDTTIAAFYLDQSGALSITLQDNNNNYIIGNGIIQLSWTNGETIQNFPPFSFGINDFTNNILSADTIKAKLDNVNLWTGGNYSIKLTDTLDKKTLRAYTDFEKSPIELKPGQDTLVTVKHFTQSASLLQAHFKSTDIVEGLLYNRVTSMQDKSGNSRDAINADPGTKPHFVKDILNGNQIIRFDASNKENLTIALKPEYANNFTIIAVARAATESAKPSYFFYADKSNNDAGCRLSLSSNGISIYENAQEVVTWNNAMATNFNVIAMKYQNKQPFLFVNGEHKAEGTESIKANIYSPYIFGGSGSSNYFSGDVAEILIYNIPLNEANIQLVTNELKTKYNLP